jgi:hypothetical protein
MLTHTDLTHSLTHSPTHTLSLSLATVTHSLFLFLFFFLHSDEPTSAPTSSAPPTQAPTTRAPVFAAPTRAPTVTGVTTRVCLTLVFCHLSDFCVVHCALSPPYLLVMPHTHPHVSSFLFMMTCHTHQLPLPPNLTAPVCSSRHTHPHPPTLHTCSTRHTHPRPHPPTCTHVLPPTCSSRHTRTLARPQRAQPGRRRFCSFVSGFSRRLLR